MSKHTVSSKALETLTKVMYAQDEYGVKKYGTTLKHTQNYDWLQMFLEEMADGLKYIQNEMDRKKQVIEILEYAVRANAMSFVETALKILRTEGTGKEKQHD